MILYLQTVLTGLETDKSNEKSDSLRVLRSGPASGSLLRPAWSKTKHIQLLVGYCTNICNQCKVFHTIQKPKIWKCETGGCGTVHNNSWSVSRHTYRPIYRLDGIRLQQSLLTWTNFILLYCYGNSKYCIYLAFWYTLLIRTFWPMVHI